MRVSDSSASLRVTTVERAPRKLDLGEDRERREARGAQHAPRVTEHRLRFLVAPLTDEQLAQVRRSHGSVLPIARLQAILLSAEIEVGRLDPPAVGVRLDTEVRLGDPSRPDVAEGRIDLDRHPLVHRLLRLAEHLVRAVERGVRARERSELLHAFCFGGGRQRQRNRFAGTPLQHADLTAQRQQPGLAPRPRPAPRDLPRGVARRQSP